MFFSEAVAADAHCARILEAQYPVFSFVSLCAGVVHIVGIVLRWERLSPAKAESKA